MEVTGKEVWVEAKEDMVDQIDKAEECLMLT
jgi:hypothetical protein